MSVGPDDACQRARLGMEFRNAISVQMPSVCVSLCVRGKKCSTLMCVSSSVWRSAVCCHLAAHPPVILQAHLAGNDIQRVKV